MPRCREALGPAAARRPARVVLLGWLVLLIAAAGAAPARAEPVTIDGYGMWDLARLGVGDQVFPLSERRIERLSVPYRLPPGAAQGPEDWYLIHLHFAIAISTSGAGHVYVSAATNDKTAAQFKFELARVDGRPRVTWSTVGIVDGSERGTTNDGRSEHRFANYLQIGGVSPGLGRLTFQLERYGDVRVESLRVFADSALEVSPLGPARVKLRPSVSATPVAGETLTVGFTLANDGGRTARQVSLAAAFDPRRLRSVDGALRRFPPLEAGESVAGRFTFRARRPGRTFVDLFARSTSNRPGARIDVFVTRRPPQMSVYTTYARWGASGLLLAASGALLAYRRRLAARGG